MDYFLKLDTEDRLYLLEHPKGFECWQTDYKLLREKREAEAESDYLEDAAIRENLEKFRCEQPLLFPLGEPS